MHVPPLRAWKSRERIPWDPKLLILPVTPPSFGAGGRALGPERSSPSRTPAVVLGPCDGRVGAGEVAILYI